MARQDLTITSDSMNFAQLLGRQRRYHPGRVSPSSGPAGLRLPVRHGWLWSESDNKFLQIVTAMLSVLKTLRDRLVAPPLPALAADERERDRRQQLSPTDPGVAAVVDANLAWLCRAQDESASRDGGVARDYSLIKGWATSYPETTGYIIPTVIELARRKQRDDLHERARRMLDWCVAIQFPAGGFQGGKIDATPCVPVTFNTGQILLGLSAGASVYRDPRYEDAMHRAAVWLRDSLDGDGCWRRYPTPFAAPGEKAYETHVAWGLFEADRVAPGHGYGDAGLRQVDWALSKQQSNGWFASNCLSDPKAPLTHTIGYVLRGVIEGYLLSRRPHLLEAAQRTARGLCAVIGADGRLAGRLDANFQATVTWVCLTGSVQIAHCLLLLYRETGDQSYLATGRRLNAFVRRTVRLDGPADQRGAVKGSFPVDGAYGQWEYLNWAAKFCIDANLLEADLTAPDRA